MNKSAGARRRSIQPSVSVGISSSFASRFKRIVESKLAHLIFRISGHYLLALVCLLVPSVGEQRFLLAGLLSVVVAPLAIWLDYRYKMSDNGWSEPLFDLLTVVVLVHLIPEAWLFALLVSVVCAQAPSISAQPNSYIYFAVNYIVLLVGMSLAGMVHQVENWYLAITLLAVLSPGLILYARWQMIKASEHRAEAQALETLKLIAGGVAHDFNNILASVSGFSEISLSRLEASHPAYSSLTEVVVAANRAALLSRQLQSFSGRLVSTMETLDMAVEIDIIVGLLRPTIAADISIEVTQSAGSFLVEGDRGQLQQVFLNIILNAAEASTAPAIVIVTMKKAEVGAICIETRDSGTGISAVNINKIFDPFYTSKPRGHGLGLASVKRIVTAHAGLIDITSTVGVGTNISITLPAAERLSKPVLDRTPSIKKSKNIILIVDDDVAIRKILASFVIARGYQVIEAANGEDCLKYLSTLGSNICAVFLDLKMPRVDGWQCLEQIRLSYALLPVLIISGFDAVSVSLAEGDEHIGFLAKPFQKQELVVALTTLLSVKESTELLQP
ncbi:MAG: response regulator [Pseudomonadales bacterium]|nr:response regulator [Pseudomonadales bacterium]